MQNEKLDNICANGPPSARAIYGASDGLRLHLRGRELRAEHDAPKALVVVGRSDLNRGPWDVGPLFEPSEPNMVFSVLNTSCSEDLNVVIVLRLNF